MSIQLTKKGVRVIGGFSALKKLRGEFERKHCVIFKQFIEPELFKHIQKSVDEARFYRSKHKNIAMEDAMVRNPVHNLLQFLTNDQKHFKWIRYVTGCGPIGCFNGRVYRFKAGQGHYDSWHSDIDEKNNRMVAMSVNLCTQRYKGGVLQIRDHDTKRVLHEVANVGFGDAAMFRLDPSLEHQVTPVTGNAARTAFAGWFQAKPDFKTFLKRRPQRSVAKSKEFTLDSRVAPTKDAAFRPGNRIAAILNSKTGLYYRLDEISGQAWQLLDQKDGQLRAVYEHLRKNYQVNERKLEKDILKLMKDLSANGLLE